MDPKKITFEYEGKKYQVSSEAYNNDTIILPDGTELAVVNGWSETEPSRPNGLMKVTYLFMDSVGSSAKEIAEIMGGSLAEEVPE